MATSGGPQDHRSRLVRLLERDAELTALGSYWADALAGRGRFIFLGGEAGAGRTSVALEFGRWIGPRGRFLSGACDAGATPRALGPLIDVADALGVGAELTDHEVRRGSMFPRVLTALGRTPTLLLLEDVHWADEATLRAGLAYCTERDLDSWLLYMQAGLAAVLLEQGKNDAAERLAEEVLRHPQVTILCRIGAMLVTGAAAVRRGDPAAGGAVVARRTGLPSRSPAENRRTHRRRSRRCSGSVRRPARRPSGATSRGAGFRCRAAHAGPPDPTRPA